MATFSGTCKLSFEPNHHFTAEIKHRLTIPDNIKNWQVFDNDTQINNSLTLKEEFSNTNIDTSTIGETDQMDRIETSISAKTTDLILHPTIFTNKELQELKETNFDEISEGEFKAIELNDNFLPTSLTPLEDIFYSNDIPRKPKIQPLNTEIEDCNIGTEHNPKMIKLSKALPPE